MTAGEEAGTRDMGNGRAVLIDLDQTLVDSRESILVAFEHALATELGRRLPRADLLRILGRPLRVEMAELAGEEEADRLVAAFRRHLASLDHLVRIFPGWEEILPELRARGYKLAVVTSKGRLFASRHLALHNLEPQVDLVVTADDTQVHKPNPEPLLLAAGKLGVAPASCLVVGDSPWDMLAGLAAGMPLALAEWGEFGEDAFAQDNVLPQFRLQSPRDLLTVCPPFEQDEKEP